jgi:hypothetical protein
MIKFSEFLGVFEYLIERLRNHSILINSKHNKGLLTTGIGVPQFQVFEKDINLEKEKFLLVLNFLARFNNNNETPDGIYHTQTAEGYIVTVKKTKDAQIIQSILSNIKLFSEHEQKKFINAAQKASIDISYFDNEIIHKSLQILPPFPTIMSNQEYFECSNKEVIDSIPERQNNIPTIHSKDAIRNEYESHYEAHPIDFTNKEELVEEIFNKLKPQYPILSKQIVKDIGMEVRKKRNIKQGRPKGRGNVIKKR